MNENERTDCLLQIPISISVTEIPLPLDDIEKKLLKEKKEHKCLQRDSTLSSLFKNTILKNSKTLESDSYKTCKTTDEYSNNFIESEEHNDSMAAASSRIRETARLKNIAYSRFENSSSASSSFSSTHSLNIKKQLDEIGNQKNKTNKNIQSCSTILLKHKKNNANIKHDAASINTEKITSEKLKKKKFPVSASFN